MITGEVDGLGACWVELELSGPTGLLQFISFMVDTGFSNMLTLPPATISALDLVYLGSIRSILGDGSVASMETFSGLLEWHECREVLQVLEADGTPLLGMNLLHGSRLTIDVIEGGPVAIARL